MSSRSTPVHMLLVAKAPVAGVAKTRLAADIGDQAAADVAAAALLDTLTAVEEITRPGQRLLSLAGDLGAARRGGELVARLAGWHQVAQRGGSFAARLVHAHDVAARLWGEQALIVQIGSDTPHVRGRDLSVLAAAAIEGGPAGCALGPALDGGWWGLATMRAGYAAALSGVPMSRPDTGRLTSHALRRAGATVRAVHELRDVDTIEDAFAVADDYPELEFSRTFCAAYDCQVLSR